MMYNYNIQLTASVLSFRYKLHVYLFNYLKVRFISITNVYKFTHISFVLTTSLIKLGVARFIDASIYRDTFPAIRIAIFFL